MSHFSEEYSPTHRIGDNQNKMPNQLDDMVFLIAVVLCVILGCIHSFESGDGNFFESVNSYSCGQGPCSMSCPVLESCPFFSSNGV